jgi:hypothetical protein
MQTKFPRVEWVTLDECARELASEAGSLPKNRIKQELLVGLLDGAIPFRFKEPPDGPTTDWTPNDFKVAAIGTGGKSHGWAELPIAGDDPEAIDKLRDVHWQDYSKLFRTAYLKRFELKRESALAFAHGKTMRHRKVDPEDNISRQRADEAQLAELLAKWPDERKRPPDREMARQLAIGNRKEETVRKRIGKWRGSGLLGSVTHKRKPLPKSTI